MPRRFSGLFYGWYLAMAGATNNFVLIGVVMIGFSAFVNPVREELGWSLTAISIGFSLRSFEQGLLSPITGLLVDRIGPRRMAFVGVAVTSGGMLLFSQSHHIGTYYVASFAMSLGMSLGAGTAYPAALMNWFERKRGRAMGVMNTGNAAGWIVVLLVALLIDAFGWRTTAAMAAGAVFVVGMSMALVIRDRPQDYGEIPDGERLPEGETLDPSLDRAQGLTPQQAVREPALYLLAISSAASIALLTSWTVYLIPHLEDVGFSSRGAAVIAGAYAFVQIALRYLVGWLGDRFGRRRLFIASFVAQAVGILLFAQLSPDRLWMLPAYYLIFGFGHAAWLVLQMTVIADYFGTRRFATIRGLTSTLQMPVNIAAPVLAGISFDRTESYELAFTIFAGGALVGALLVAVSRRPSWPPTEVHDGSDARTGAAAGP